MCPSTPCSGDTVHIGYFLSLDKVFIPCPFYINIKHTLARNVSLLNVAKKYYKGKAYLSCMALDNLFVAMNKAKNNVEVAVISMHIFLTGVFEENVLSCLHPGSSNNFCASY